MWLCLTPRLKPSLSYQWSPFLFLPPLSSIESIFLFLLFHLPASSFEGFTYHQRTPAISSKTANPARYSGDVGCIQLRKALSKAHGILMIVAWPGLAGTAMLFAAFLKPVLKKGKWFQVWHDKIWDPSGLNLSSSSSLPPSSSLILPPSSLPHSSSLPHPFTGTSGSYAALCPSGCGCLCLDFCCTCRQHTSRTHGPHWGTWLLGNNTQSSGIP